MFRNVLIPTDGSRLAGRGVKAGVPSWSRTAAAAWAA